MKITKYFIVLLLVFLFISCSDGSDRTGTSVLQKGTQEEKVLEIYKLVSSKQSSLINPNARAIPLETNKLKLIPEWLKGTWETEIEYQGQRVTSTFVIDGDNVYLLADNIASDLGSYVLSEDDETCTDTTYSVIQNGMTDYQAVFTNEGGNVSFRFPQSNWLGQVDYIEGTLAKVDDIDILSGKIIPELPGVKGIMIEHNPLAGLEEENISTSDVCNYYDIFFSYDDFSFYDSGTNYTLKTGENGYSQETSRFYSIIIEYLEETVGDEIHYYAIQDSIQYTSFNYNFEISDGSILSNLVLKGSYTLKMRSNAKTHETEGSIEDITIEEAFLDGSKLDNDLVKEEFKKFAESMLNRF